MSHSAAEALGKAREAFGKRSYDEAIAFCKEALQMVDKEMSGEKALRLRADVLTFLAEVTDVTGAWVDSLLYLDGVAQISTALGDMKLTVNTLIQAGDIISKKGKWADALRKFEKAEQIATKQGIHKLLGRALVGKGIILWRMGKYIAAIHEAERAAKIGETVSDPQLVGSANALVASVRFDTGDYQSSMTSNKKALEMFEAAKDVFQMSRVLNNLGETYKMLGDYKAAIEHLTRCYENAEKAGSKRNMGYALMNLAECHARDGNWPEAMKSAQKAEAQLAGIEDKYAHAYLAMVWGMVQVSRNDITKAISHFDSALKLMTEMKIPYDTGVVQFEYGNALKRLGEKERGRDFLQDAILSFEVAGARAMKAKVEKALAEME